MNALRNIFSTRTLSYLRQHGQNTLFNITQSVEPAAGSTETTTNNSAKNDAKFNKSQMIPKSILDATTFTGKKFHANGPQNLSPTTLKRVRCLERKMELVYRCKLCNTRNTKMISEAAYTSGVVILQCDGCSVNHLIIDNLGWFVKGRNFDDVLAEKRNHRIKIIKVNEQGDLI